MKLEIEITEDEIKSAIERKIRVAIADETNDWKTGALIKERVKALFPLMVNKVITECLEDSPALKKKINKALEQKLKSQLTAMLKASK